MPTHAPRLLAPSTPWNIFRIMAILFGTQCPFSEKTSAEPWQHYAQSAGWIAFTEILARYLGWEFCGHPLKIFSSSPNDDICPKKLNHGVQNYTYLCNFLVCGMPIVLGGVPIPLTYLWFSNVPSVPRFIVYGAPPDNSMCITLAPCWDRQSKAVVWGQLLIILMCDLLLAQLHTAVV